MEYFNFRCKIQLDLPVQRRYLCCRSGKEQRQQQASRRPQRLQAHGHQGERLPTSTERNQLYLMLIKTCYKVGFYSLPNYTSWYILDGYDMTMQFSSKTYAFCVITILIFSAEWQLDPRPDELRAGSERGQRERTTLCRRRLPRRSQWRTPR